MLEEKGQIKIEVVEVCERCGGAEREDAWDRGVWKGEHSYDHPHKKMGLIEIIKGVDLFIYITCLFSHLLYLFILMYSTGDGKNTQSCRTSACKEERRRLGPYSVQSVGTA